MDLETKVCILQWLDVAMAAVFAVVLEKLVGG